MKPISTKRAEKIARNINAMDLYYQYSDDFNKWSFWHNLSSKLNKILSTLSEADRKVIANLCDKEQATYFNLV